MTKSTATTDWYSQRITIDSAGTSGIKPGDLLTLRADVKLAGVPVPSGTDGIQINLNCAFSGMVKTDNVIVDDEDQDNDQDEDKDKPGASYKLDYYDIGGHLMNTHPIQTSALTGTKDFTRLSRLATAPEGAYYVRLTAQLIGSGTAYFDDIKLVPRNSTLTL